MPSTVRRLISVRFLIVCICVTTTISFFLASIPVASNCNNDKSMESSKPKLDESLTDTKNGHQLAVIVPFRDRFEELLEFIPHLADFLKKQNVPHIIYIINQADNLRFNRASLINVGYLESKQECDYIAMHDVDLLPLNPQINYTYPELGPYHAAAPHLHPLYHYPTFVGGILLIRGDHFSKVNGLSNRYWGWGKEDDEFYVRMKQAELKIYSPGMIGTGPKDTFKHLHDRLRRKRDNIRYGDQKKISRMRDYVTGVDTVQYTVIKKYKFSVQGAEAIILNIKLECNMVETPWCIHHSK